MENDDYVPAGGRTSTIEDGPALSPEDEHRTLMAKDPGSYVCIALNRTLTNQATMRKVDSIEWGRTFEHRSHNFHRHSKLVSHTFPVSVRAGTNLQPYARSLHAVYFRYLHHQS